MWSSPLPSEPGLLDSAVQFAQVQPLSPINGSVQALANSDTNVGLTAITNRDHADDLAARGTVLTGVSAGYEESLICAAAVGAPRIAAAALLPIVCFVGA